MKAGWVATSLLDSSVCVFPHNTPNECYTFELCDQREMYRWKITEDLELIPEEHHMTGAWAVDRLVVFRRPNMNADPLYEATLKTLSTWCECFSLEKIVLTSLDKKFIVFWFFLIFTLESPVNLQEWLWRLENATKASIGIVLGSKWMEFQFGVNQRPTHRFTHKLKQWILSDISYSPPQLNFCLTV